MNKYLTKFVKIIAENPILVNNELLVLTTIFEEMLSYEKMKHSLNARFKFLVGLLGKHLWSVSSQCTGAIAGILQ